MLSDVSTTIPSEPGWTGAVAVPDWAPSRPNPYGLRRLVAAPTPRPKHHQRQLDLGQSRARVLGLKPLRIATLINRPLRRSRPRNPSEEHGVTITRRTRTS